MPGDQQPEGEQHLRPDDASVRIPDETRKLDPEFRAYLVHRRKSLKDELAYIEQILGTRDSKRTK